MCVTNTTQRRNNAVVLSPSQLGGLTHTGSMISQRLLASGYLPQQQPIKPVGPVVPAAPASVPLPAEYISAHQEKPRPKRRRKPQKPGKTAKMNDRHFVVHNYHDHAEDPEESPEEHEVAQEEAEHANGARPRRGGVAVAFPLRLHAVLDQVEADGYAGIVSWQPHGRCFVVHKPKEFVEHIMPKYFRQTKLTSFQRQLNLYGFSRLTRGADAGGYYHELFLRGKSGLCKKMVRTKVKGTKFKAASSPDQEPDFYSMPSIVVTPHNTSDEESAAESHPSADSFPSQQPSFGLSYGFEPVAAAAAAAATFQLPSLIQSAVQQPVSFPSLTMGQGIRASEDDADRVLDEAVDELFMQGLTPASGDEELADFLHDWDPNFSASLRDDTQLGMMLERLLED